MYSDAGTWGLGGSLPPLLPPIFCRTINPIPTGEGRLSPLINTGTPNFFHLPASLMHACNRGCSCRLVVLMYYILSTIMHYSIKTGSSLDISIWMTFKIPAWLTDIIFDLIAHFWKKLRSFFGYKVIMVQYLPTYLLTKYVFRKNPLYLLHKSIENAWEKGVFKFSNSPCF